MLASHRLNGQPYLPDIRMEDIEFINEVIRQVNCEKVSMSRCLCCMSLRLCLLQEGRASKRPMIGAGTSQMAIIASAAEGYKSERSEVGT